MSLDALALGRAPGGRAATLPLRPAAPWPTQALWASSTRSASPLIPARPTRRPQGMVYGRCPRGSFCDESPPIPLGLDRLLIFKPLPRRVVSRTGSSISTCVAPLTPSRPVSPREALARLLTGAGHVPAQEIPVSAWKIDRGGTGRAVDGRRMLVVLDNACVGGAGPSAAARHGLRPGAGDQPKPAQRILLTDPAPDSTHQSRWSAPRPGCAWMGRRTIRPRRVGADADRVVDPGSSWTTRTGPSVVLHLQVLRLHRQDQRRLFYGPGEPGG